MSKKIQDDNGNTYVAVKPWYKKWWIWVIVVLLVLVGLGSLGNDDSNTSSSNSSATAHKTANSADSAASDETLSVDYKDYAVASKKIYSVNYTNSSWSAASIKINKVTVYKLAKAYKYDSANDGKFKANGFIRIHVTVNANRDISAYPTQGTVVYSNGEQHEADSLESWDGDISKDAIKSGNVTIPVKDLKSTSSLKSIRFKFDANYETDNIDDNNSDKTFDTTLELNK